MTFRMHLSMSTITEDQHHRYENHDRYDHHEPMAYDFVDGQAGGSGGVGGGRVSGYAMSEMSGSDYGSSLKRGSRQGVLICVSFVIEFLLLVFVIVIEYFLRWTDVFPLRRQNFTCNDTSIACMARDKELMGDFAFDADVPDEAIYALSFCVPPFVVLIGEVGLCTFSEGQQKSIRLMNKHCSVPQVIRRLLRFLGVFLFGGFTLMVFVDVTKMMVGRLRPDFLDRCHMNISMCNSSSLLDDSACLNTHRMDLRTARTSFPSLNTALTSYAAFFIAVYIHGAMRGHSVRILRPFLALIFILLSLLSGLAEFGRCHAHWEDVVVGHAVGIVAAVYLTVVVLNQFQEHMTQTEILHMLRVFMADAYYPYYEDKSHLVRPADQLPSLHIPRAHMGPSRLSESAEGGKAPRRRPYNTFQRDLSQSIDYHRRHHPYLHAGSSHM